MDREEIVIRPITEPDKLRACHEVQVQTWGMKDREEIIPDHQFIAAVRNGGAVLGAYDGDKLIGFNYGFIGLNEDGKIHVCSHILGVLPDYRGLGLGYRLKVAQREYFMEKGIDLITWTFEPLEIVNASLNFNKLGVISRKYYLEYYGEMLDALNKGLPSDRLLVEWHLKSKKVEEALAGKKQEFPQGPEVFTVLEVLPSHEGPKPFLKKPGSEGEEFSKIAAEIPAGFQQLKKTSPKLALDWRLAVREVILHYLDRGYIVHNLYMLDKNKAAYVLVKEVEMDEN
ncbi:MAG: GNAT family N-acetyltransferase [Bacillota bacterium]